MIIPASTYRVQLHKDFTLKDLENILEYLDALGITTIYASPIFSATPGSTHGYDVTDPHSINPEIGTIDDLRRIAGRLKEKKMSWIQDIVPNHMAFHAKNFRLMDVLERGEHSPYHHYFDILWNHPAPNLMGKLQVPFLGKHLDECITSDEIRVIFSDKGLTVDYLTTSYPLSINAYRFFLQDDAMGKVNPGELERGGKTARNVKEWTELKNSFILNVLDDEKRNFTLLETLEAVNADKDRLRRILGQQYYTLTHWKDTEREIGYRRFFTVNELICLRMEDQGVFNEYHSFLHSLFSEGIIQGVRIDHVDGLKNPSQYIGRLRKLFGEDCYIIAEKILETKESIPDHWSLQGTSGYEFLSHVNQLITDRKGAKDLVAFYRTLVPEQPAYKDLVVQNKRMILEQYMAGEWENVTEYFVSLGLSQDFNRTRIKQALGSLMISLSVYRIYPTHLPLAGDELQIMNETFGKASAESSELKAELDYLKNLFTANPPNPGTCERVLCFLQRLMQFTGPLTAKGVEDTTFYTYNALISHDEVGDAPSNLGISVNNFHTRMTERQRSTPFSLNATATHDTKRGEDSRLRLNALGEYPGEWRQVVTDSMELNRGFHQRLPTGKIAPVVNEEYFIYQAIIGGFPAERAVTTEWIERLQAYLTKVVREAKANSDWGDPDRAYEEASLFFIRQILLNESSFLKFIFPFIITVMEHACLLALAQVLIKITSPGIPDIYQGCELWDLSFVDPDNRRPVDYIQRKGLLDQINLKSQEGVHALFSFLRDRRSEGAEKMFATWKALHFRRSHPELFNCGTYIPLQLTDGGRNTVAYARRLDASWTVIVASLAATNGTTNQKPPVDAEILLPEQCPCLWRNVFTDERIKTDGRISLSACFKDFPVAMFAND